MVTWVLFILVPDCLWVNSNGIFRFFTFFTPFFNVVVVGLLRFGCEILLKMFLSNADLLLFFCFDFAELKTWVFFSGSSSTL